MRSDPQICAVEADALPLGHQGHLAVIAIYHMTHYYIQMHNKASKIFVVMPMKRYIMRQGQSSMMKVMVVTLLSH